MSDIDYNDAEEILNFDGANDEPELEYEVVEAGQPEADNLVWEAEGAGHDSDGESDVTDVDLERLVNELTAKLEAELEEVRSDDGSWNAGTVHSEDEGGAEVSDEEGTSGGVRKTRVLTDDIMIDCIMRQLDVEDIAKLRQVCEQFYECSTQAAVWKRRFERAKYRLPPLPPTERYSFAKLNAVEAERLLTRISSLARRWDEEAPRYCKRWNFNAWSQVTEMVLLPGGQYMVASVADRSWQRFSIQVFTADFQYAQAAPIARLDIETKAFDLRAKYMTIHGVPGIVIAWVRRRYGNPKYGDTDRFKLNELPVDFEPHLSRHGKKLKYECTVAHIALTSLELLGDGTIPQNGPRFLQAAREQGKPFQFLAEIISRSRLSSPAIDDDVGGVPLVAVLKHPEGVADRIVYKNLNGGPGFTLSATPHPDYQALTHAILAFSIIPIQKQFLVVRRAGDNIEPGDLDDDTDEHTGPYYFAEFWDIVDDVEPTALLTRIPAERCDAYDCEGNYWQKVWISDHGLGPALAHDRSLRAELLGGERPPLRPINILVQAKLFMGVGTCAIVPAGDPRMAGRLEMTDPGRPMYRYAFREELFQFDPWALGDEEELLPRYEPRVLPGQTRPLWYLVSRRGARTHHFNINRLMCLWERLLMHTVVRDIPAAAPGQAQPDEDADMPAVDDSIELDGSVRLLDIDRADLRGVSAIAWDDTIGRLCVAYAKSTRIAVFDFAAAPLRA
ncbi:hypothetical protein OH77DRAFT_1592241 [Trametes cingulata]|nr:hypothetical protein OH77DRAFT_1592241 [Trametes cingulata]